MRKNFFIILLFTFFSLLGCRKQSVNSWCDKLKNGMVTDNIEEVKSVIENFIADLPAQDYSQANMNKLAQSISTKCGITANIYCFDCIKTLPSQTEITVIINNSTQPLTKIIDITYTPGSRMTFVNMHD